MAGDGRENRAGAENEAVDPVHDHQHPDDPEQEFFPDLQQEQHRAAEHLERVDGLVARQHRYHDAHGGDPHEIKRGDQQGPGHQAPEVGGGSAPAAFEIRFLPVPHADDLAVHREQKEVREKRGEELGGKRKCD